MATTVKTQAQAAPTTTISKYRGLVHFMAVQELGFKHTQPQTTIDQYTKGDETITLSWGSGKLVAFQVTKGGQPQGIVQGMGSMLQRAQKELGKPIPLTGPGSKWNLSSKAKADMEAYAAKVFKVVKEA